MANLETLIFIRIAAVANAVTSVLDDHDFVFCLFICLSVFVYCEYELHVHLFTTRGKIRYQNTAKI